MFVSARSSGTTRLHGVVESQFSYEYLGRHWASNGYVAVHPTYEDSDVRVTIGRNPVTPALREAALTHSSRQANSPFSTVQSNPK